MNRVFASGCALSLGLVLSAGVGELVGSRPVQAASASDPYQSTIVPIKLAVDAKENGKLVYSIPVSFTTTTLQAVLDTGSIPLLVLEGHLSPRDGQPTGATSTETYGDNRKYAYAVDLGRVLVGAERRSIDVGIVTKANCLPADPTCPIAGENASTALFGGLYPAIVGARITTETDAPQIAFRQLGVHRFVITAPRQGEGDGYLQLDPYPALTSSFVPVYRDDDSAAPGGSLRGCLRNRTSGAYYCGAVFFDSGTTGISVTPASGGARSVWSAKDKAQLELTGPDNSDVAGVDFVVGADAPTTVTIATPGQASEPVIKIGQLPYLGLSVLTDLDAGTYAVAPRPPAKDGVVGHVP